MNENEYKLEIYVTKDNVTIKNKEKIHTGEYKITKCEFEFTEDYEGLTKKAIFEAEDVIKEMPIISNECDIPEEVLQDGYLQCNLRVYGYDIEEVDGEMTVRLRYSPTYDTFPIWKGSFIPNAEQGEEITPTQFEQYTAALNEGLEAIEDKIEEADAVLEDIDTAIEETNNLDLDVSKEGKVATVTLTKKDATTKTVTLSDGTSLMFNWDGTKLGIKTDEDAEYTYVDLQGVQGPIGPQGEAFQIKKTYSSVAEMNADFDNMQLGDYVMIASSVQIEDNAKLYTRGQEAWIFISDFSGAQGIKGETGATPNIQIGSVTSGNAPSVTRTGTNENPILNFVLEKGEKGDTGDTGATGETGNGIASIVKTGTSGLVDTYTITFTDGTTTTFEITNGEDGEVTQAQLDATNRMVEQAKLVYNALPKVTGSGEEITLNNTAETPLGITLKGNTYQETTTGKNLFNESNMYNGYYNVQSGELTSDNSYRTMIIENLPSGTYTFSTTLSNCRILRYWCDNASTNIGANKQTQTFTTTTSGKVMVSFREEPTAEITETFNTQLEIGTEASSYEPYTNGASPNPDYPQEVQVVTGDNKIFVDSKNLLDFDDFLNYSNVTYTKDGNTYSITESGSVVTNRYKLDLEPNQTYTLSCKYLTQSTPNVRVQIYEESTALGGAYTTGPIYKTFTTQANKNYYLNMTWSSPKTYPILYPEPQLEWGDTKTSFEPFKGVQKYPINLGKNLFNINSGLHYSTNASGETSVNENFTSSDYIPCQPGEKYTMSGYVSSTADIRYKLVCFDKDKNFISRLLTNAGALNQRNAYTTTIPINGAYVMLQIDNRYVTQAQLEKSAYVTYYAPYFTPIELCKIGDYQDYIYKNNNKWYVHKEIDKIIFDGTQGWSGGNEIGGHYSFFMITDIIKLNSENNDEILVISDRFKGYIPEQVINSSNIGITSRKYAVGQGIYIRSHLESASTSAWDDYLRNNNVTAYYVKSIPTDTEITEPTLIEQLNNLYYAYAYQGQTNINQGNADIPFVLTAETTRDLSDIFTNEG